MTNPDWTGYEPGSQNPPFNPAGQQPSYGYQPYGAHPPAAPQYGAWQPQPPDYRAWVIAAIAGGVLFNLLIGLPLALIAQRSSRRVRSRSASGDHDGAVRASRSARAWAIASIVFDLLGLVLVIVVSAHAGHPAS